MAGLVVPGAAVSETTLHWKATGYVVVDAKNYPMADGSTQQNYVSKVIYLVSEGDMAGQYYVSDCVGTGNVGADSKYLGNFTCTATFSADDALTVHIAADNGESLESVVTGGKGKYKGATGGAKAQYIWGDTNFGDRLVISEDFTLTLP